RPGPRRIRPETGGDTDFPFDASDGFALVLSALTGLFAAPWSMFLVALLSSAASSASRPWLDTDRPNRSGRTACAISGPDLPQADHRRRATRLVDHRAGNGHGLRELAYHNRRRPCRGRRRTSLLHRDRHDVLGLSASRFTARPLAADDARALQPRLVLFPSRQSRHRRRGGRGLMYWS